MDEVKSVKNNCWVWNVILIIIFLLMPGIRGYENWQIHEYVLFVGIPVIYLIYDIFKRKRMSSNSPNGE